MAKKRANGEGSIRKRSDGRWEGRYTAGRNPETGKPIYKNVLGKTQAEVKEKLAEAIERSRGVDMARAGKCTLGPWMEVWFENVAQVKVRPPPMPPTVAIWTTILSPTSGTFRCIS